LKDQDRIFTNVYNKHDWGIKGAMVSSNEGRKAEGKERRRSAERGWMDGNRQAILVLERSKRRQER